MQPSNIYRTKLYKPSVRSSVGLLLLTYAIAYVIVEINVPHEKDADMTSITATALRQNIYQTIAEVNASCTPIVITSGKGKGAVLVGEDEWAAIEETLYLTSIPKMSESLQAGVDEPISECLSEHELEW